MAGAAECDLVSGNAANPLIEKGIRVKVLVTGGAGYIGGIVTRELIAAGHQVVMLDDLSTGFADTIPDGVQFHQLPLTEAGRVLTPDAGFDGVLHFAAKLQVAESVARPDLYWNNNVGGTMALLAAMRAAGIPRLIFSSTGALYDASGVVAQPGGGFSKLDENAATRPSNPYGATKLAVDLMLAGECEAFGLGAASLRYFNASGAVGNLGERHTPESHLIPIVLQVAGGRRDQLMMYGDDYPTPDGTCIRDYVHVADLATAHLLALESLKPGRHEIYNLGNGDGYSVRQVIDAAREVTGRPIPVKLAPRRPGDPAATVASSDKARRELGWNPGRPGLHDIIADAWAFDQAFSGARLV
jgi:UDP-glucose 4-epimerase